jgi:hypothetical protein
MNDRDTRVAAVPVRARRRCALDPHRPPPRWLLRLPLALCRAGLGWPLGERVPTLTVHGRAAAGPNGTAGRTRSSSVHCGSVGARAALAAARSIVRLEVMATS